MHVTYDIEFYGPNTMTNTIYLGAVKGVAEMAEYLGKQRKRKNTGLCMRKRSRWWMKCCLTVSIMCRSWRMDAYRYQYGTGCLTDQLLGQFMAHAAGLGYVLPREHVKDSGSHLPL